MAKKQQRIAIFSDIHGNLTGLEACLADLQAQGGADVHVAAGDLCMDGPKPKKVLQRLHEIGAQCLRGNTDRYIGAQSEEEMAGADAADRKQLDWQRKEIGEKWVLWLRTLPFSLRFGSEENQLLVVHANPTTDNEHLWPGAEDDVLERLIGSEPAGTIAFGHLHIPYVRMWRGKMLVNVSSAGLPKDGDPRAGYAILTERSGGWEVRHRRAAFDVKKVATQLADSGIPGSSDLITTLRRHRYKRLKSLIP
ncbi:MAG TPA: metallophosphoesterase family protein [Candidatus Rubrimentiphilum sp.]|nr:metallophosphoesterase family protein [Candidatus Rubrimentiphilum sp.]